MRRLACVIAVAVMLVGCSSGDDKEKATDLGGQTLEQATCDVVATAQAKILTPNDLTFSKIVAEDEANTNNAGVAGLVFLARHRQSDPIEGTLGPYEAALAYIDDRGLAWSPEFASDNPMPERTDEVIESAERLDADLADGMCKK